MTYNVFGGKLNLTHPSSTLRSLLVEYGTVNGWILFHWLDLVGPGMAVLFACAQRKNSRIGSDRVQPAKKNLANITLSITVLFAVLYIALSSVIRYQLQLNVCIVEWAWLWHSIK